MTVFDMLAAKSNLSRLLDAVESGRETEIIIARNGKPAARLVPLASRPEGRRLGVAKGLFEVPDDIDGANPAIARKLKGQAPMEPAGEPRRPPL